MADERLRVILAVARCGSFSRAAKELFISQPAVTQQVQKLEAEYNAVLFRRHERGVDLTPAGHILVDYATRIQELQERAAEDVAALGESLQGTLRLGATFTLGEYVLPPIMGQFKALHPQVELLLEVENTAKVVDHVASGQYACGLIEGPYRNPLIRAEKLADDELVVVVAPQHRLGDRLELTLDELMTEPLILREPGSGARMVFEEALREVGCEPAHLSVLMQLGSTQAVKGLVCQRFGISVLPAWTVRDEMQRGELRPLAVPALDLRRTLNFIFASAGRLPLTTRQFVQFCRKQMAAG